MVGPDSALPYPPGSLRDKRPSLVARYGRRLCALSASGL